MPGPKLLHNIAFPEYTPSADEIKTFDLPVNPLSILLLTIRPLNDTGTLSTYAGYKEICQAFNNVNIAFRGQSIINMRGEDIAAFNWYRWGMCPWEANPDNVDNERRAVVLPIVFGRWPYSPTSCFPASKRGELTCTLDMDIADTGYDTLKVSAESIELLGANPKEFEKRTQQTITFPATGDNDVELPLGNLIRGLFCFGTTDAGGAAPAPTLGRLKLLLDNTESGYASTDFEVANMLASLWGRQAPFFDHKHLYDGSSAGVAETLTGNSHDVGERFNTYCWLDLDPTGDDTYALDTKGSSSFKVRVNAETANAARFVPVEVLTPSQLSI
jgi:hypothetical protein